VRVLLSAIALRSGMVQYAAELASELVQEHEVAVVTAAADAFAPGVEVLRLDIRRGALWGVAAAYRQLARFVRTWRPDIAHVTTVNVRNLVLNAALMRLPRVVTVHDVQLHPGDEAPAIRVAAWHHKRAGEFWIVHGENLRRLLQAEGKPEHRIAVIPLGPLLRGPQEPAPEPGVPTVLFFGRIREYKGLDILLRAMRLLVGEFPDLRLMIAGSGPLAAYRELMSGLPCEVINRFIADDEVGDLFARSTVLACPYIEASQSGVVPLAYAFGRPVIASAVGDIPEAVIDGETGVLVPPGDVDRTAAALRAVLGQPALRDRLREGGRRLLLSELSWPAIARRTGQVYRALLESHGVGCGGVQADVDRRDRGQTVSQEQLCAPRQEPQRPRL
jgi:starch synthase